MATRDFRSQQIRTTQIIASGSDTTSKPSLLIYSASSATNDQGAVAASLLNNVGKDVWLFIDGSTSLSDNEQVLFAGNVVTSGSIFGSTLSSLPAGDLTLEAGDDIIFKSSTVEFFQIKNDSQDEVVVNDGSADIDFRVESNNLQSAIHVNANQDLIVLGRAGAPADLTAASTPAVGTDVKVFIDGTANSKNGATRGTALVAGDLVVSGTLFAEKQVMEVDLSQTGQLVMSGGVHFKNLGAAAGSGGQTGIVVEPNDGAIFVSTGSLFLRTKVGSGFVENKVGQGYAAGVGLNETTVASLTTFSTDNRIVAHLTGSEFNGSVGITGSLGVVGDISLAAEDNLFLNGLGGDVRLKGYANALDIVGDDELRLYSDSSTLIDVGNNDTMFSTDKVEFNTNNNDVDFEVNTNNYNATLFVDGADESIILGAQNFTSTPSAADLATKGYGTDVKIMLSGSTGFKDTTTRAVVVATGDMVVSGTLFGPTGIHNIKDANEGVKNTSGVAQLDLNSLTTSATIAVGDSIAFIDADGSSATKKGTIADLVTAIAGDGLSNVSNQLQVGVDGSTIERSSDQLRVKDSGITAAKIATAVAGAGLNGGGGSALSVDAGTGLKIGSSSELKTDDAVVAHLSGSQFNGTLGVTGSLGVIGDLTVSQFIRHAGDSDTHIQIEPDSIVFTAGNKKALNLSGSGANFAVVINEGSDANLDFRVESDNDSKIIFVNSGLDYISIGDDSSNGEAGKGVQADNHLFVSGSVGGVTSFDGASGPGGVAVFGGDVVVSGTLLDSAHNPIKLSSYSENGTFSTAPNATGTNAVAIGNNTVASGNRSITIGSGISTNEATGQSSAALGGENITASGDYSAVLGGHNNTASGHHSKVIGRDSTASGEASIAIGGNLTVPESNTIALGSGTNHAQKVVASGSFEVTGSATIDGAVTLADSDGDVTLGNNASLVIPHFLKHKADTNTYLQFNVDRIRLVTNGVAKSDFTTNQVLFLSGGNSASPDPAAGADVNFFVSGTLGSKDTAIRGTSVFGGDVHISGALSGPSQYALTDNSVRLFRDGSTMKFVDGITGTKTLEELASVAASTSHFIGVHGANSQVSRIHTSASIAFAGGLNNFVTNLAANGVGSDVYFFVSGTLGGKDGSTRHTALFGGDVVVSGSTHLADITGSFLKATGPIVAAGNIIKNSNNDTVARFHNAVPGVMFGSDALPQTTVDIRLADNTVLASAADGNDFSNYNIALRNNSTTTNAFAGIAFDVHDEDDPDSIGASIAVLRDQDATSTLHKANMVFMTNDAGDDGLTERVRITHDGKVGIGIDTPSRKLDVNGDVRVRGNNILDSGDVVITFDGSQNTALAGALNVTGDITGSAFSSTTGNYFAPPGQSLGLYSPHHVVVKLDTDNNGAAEFQIDNGAGTEVFVVNESGDLQIDGDLTVSGNDIKDSGGGTVLTFDGSQNTTLGGGLSFPSTQGITGSLRTEKSSDVIFSANAGGLNIDKSHTFFLDASAGKIGIGTASPTSKLHIVTDQNVAGANGGDNSIVMESVNGSGAFNGAFIFRRAKGTIGSEALADQGTRLGEIIFEGYDGTDFEPAAAIKANVSYTASGNNDMPGKLSFYTTADGAASPTERVVINHDGQLIVYGQESTFVGNSEKLLVRDDWNKGNTPIAQFGIYNGSGAFANFTVDTDSNVGLGFAHASNDNLTISGSLKVEQTLELDGPIIGNGATNIQISHTGADGDDGLLIVREDTSTTTNDLLGGIGFDSTDGNVPSSITEASAFIAGYAAEPHSFGDKGGYLVLGTSAINDNDDTVSNEVMRIGSDRLVTLQGDIQIGGNDILASDGTTAITLDSSNATVSGVLTVGADADGVDRKLRFGHTTIKSVIGIDDSQDVFAINTDQDFENSNDFEIDASGNVTIGNGNLIIDGGEVRGASSGQLKLYADTNVCINIDVDGSGTDALFKVQTNSQDTKFEIDESGNVLLDGDLTVSGGDISGPTDGQLKLKADLGVIIELDDDNDGNQSFKVRNGANTDVLEVDESGNAQISGKISGASASDPFEAIQRRIIPISAAMSVSTLDGGSDKLWLLGGTTASDNTITGDPDLDTSDVTYGMLMPYDFTVKEIVFTSTHFQNAQHDLFVHRRNATETSTDTSISTSVFSQDFYLGTSAFTAGQVQRETGSVSGTAGQSIFIELSAAAGDVKSPGTSTTITSGLVYIQGYVVVEEDTTTLYSG